MAGLQLWNPLKGYKLHSISMNFLKLNEERLQLTLRLKIEKAIADAEDAESSAMNVCKLLEHEIGLAGNGWFDDDDELLAALDDDN